MMTPTPKNENEPIACWPTDAIETQPKMDSMLSSFQPESVSSPLESSSSHVNTPVVGLSICTNPTCGRFLVAAHVVGWLLRSHREGKRPNPPRKVGHTRHGESIARPAFVTSHPPAM